MTEPLNLNCKDAAGYLGISERKLRMLTEQGYLRRLPVSGNYAVDELKQFNEDQRNGFIEKRWAMGCPSENGNEDESLLRSNGTRGRGKKTRLPHLYDDMGDHPGHHVA